MPTALRSAGAIASAEADTRWGPLAALVTSPMRQDGSVDGNPRAVTAVVDGYELGGFSSTRGIGRYLDNVLGRLPRPGLEVTLLTPKGVEPPPGVSAAPLHRWAPDRFAGVEHGLRLGWDMARTPGDVLFAAGLTAPVATRRPVVQTIFDTTPLRFAVGSRSAIASWRRNARRARRAAAVIAISQASADDAVRWLGVPTERIHVVHLGVSPTFVPGSRPPGAAAPRLLFVGEYGPHKGHEEAFAVIAELAERGLPHSLRVASRLAPWHRPIVEALVARSGAPERVELLDYVPDIVEEYLQAEALVITSRNEGFCLPALEAMACGIPVVAFANSALPEVIGDAGVLVPDGDVRAMVDALARLLSDGGYRAELAAAGVERARQFTWEACADAHAEILLAAAATS